MSDEFTVPLCAIHHRENHTTGDERRWWQERKIDPLVVAQELWKATTGIKDPDWLRRSRDCQVVKCASRCWHRRIVNTIGHDLILVLPGSAFSNRFS